MLRIVNYPHPALRYSSRPVTEIDDGLRATIQGMFELMYAAKGIGLAANQVDLPFRFFVLNLTADPGQKERSRSSSTRRSSSGTRRSRMKRAA